jgi:hypothetical protein
VTRILLVGFDPAEVPGMDADALEPAFAHGRERAREEGVELVECLVKPDASAVADITASLEVVPAYDAVVIGGGVRKPAALLEFFEVVTNLVHVRSPGSALAFNTSPADTVEAALRAIGVVEQLR